MQILYLELYRVQAFKVIKFCGDEARSGRSTNEICPVIYERAANRCHGDESKAIVNSRLNLHTRSDIVPWHGDKKLRCGYLLLGTMKYIRGAEYCFTSAIDHRDCRTWPQFFRTNNFRSIIFILVSRIRRREKDNEVRERNLCILYLENSCACKEKKFFFISSTFLRKWHVHPTLTSFIWFRIMDGHRVGLLQ